MAQQFPDMVERLLSSPSPEERRMALITLGKLRYHRLVARVMSILQEDHDTEVRAMAAWTLDILSTPEAVPSLVQAMYDNDFGVRSNAGWALVHLASRMYPPMLLPEVIDVLYDQAHPDAQQMAYLVLKRIDHEDARRAIRDYGR